MRLARPGSARTRWDSLQRYPRPPIAGFNWRGREERRGKGGKGGEGRKGEWVNGGKERRREGKSRLCSFVVHDVSALYNRMNCTNVWRSSF